MQSYILLVFLHNCAIMCVTVGFVWQSGRNGSEQMMMIEIDFQSDEAIYIQLMNQIILGIATQTIQEGEALPSVRQMAEDIGINMHTVNKAYSVLRQEGFLQLDRRKGAVISLDINKLRAMEELRENLRVSLARACCKNISEQEIHGMVDDILKELKNGRM